VNRWPIPLLSLLMLVALAWASPARAEESEGTPAPAASAASGGAPSGGEAAAPAPAQPKKGGRVRERAPKDTEGTEALGRFEANTVIKSQYKLGGEPLEVDPD
jgi:hypothetical protein